MVTFPKSQNGLADELISARNNTAPSGSDYLVHARALNGFPAYLAQAGINYDDIARQAELLDVDTERLDTYVRLSHFAHFLELAADATGDELFALRWISHFDETALGPLSLCVAYAPTMRQALEVLARFLTIHVDVASCELSEEAGITTFAWTYTPLVLQQDQLADRGAGLCIGRMRAMLPGNTAPLRVELARSQPRSTALHRSLFGANVHFECDRNSFSYRNEYLDLSNPKGDPNLFLALTELNARLVGERRRQSDLVMRVREEILRRMADEAIALEPIARQLGHSSRSLQRKLAGYNTTFNSLLELTRREAAKRYMEETDLLISEIAYRLGFSTIGNFTRAAKRWFGCTPREYRQGLQSMAKRG